MNKSLTIGLTIIFTIAFLCGDGSVHAQQTEDLNQNPGSIQIYEVKSARVVESLPLDPAQFQRFKQLINGRLTDYIGFRIEPEDGMIVRFAFRDPIPFPREQARITEAYLFLEPSPESQAKLMVFTADHRMHAYLVDRGACTYWLRFLRSSSGA